MSSEARGLRGAGTGMSHGYSLLQTDIVERSGCLVTVAEGARKCIQVACMLLRNGRRQYLECEESQLGTVGYRSNCAALRLIIEGKDIKIHLC
jgi:hypothetical protein